jgi:hypothetical protein
MRTSDGRFRNNDVAAEQCYMLIIVAKIGLVIALCVNRMVPLLRQCREWLAYRRAWREYREKRLLDDLEHSMRDAGRSAADVEARRDP